MKQCSKCKQIKSFGEFHKRCDSKDGFTSHCKPCRNAHQRQYIKDPEVGATRAAYKKQWRIDNEEHYKAQRAQYLKENAEHIKARQAQYRKENAEDRAAYNAQYYKDNADARKAYGVKWWASNKLQMALSKGAKRAAERGNDVTDVTADAQYAYWEVHGISKDHCHYCQVHFGALEQREQTIDHVQAIANGGPHTVENIVPACMSCNSSKNDREINSTTKQF